MGLSYSTDINQNIYDWKPELPDFRDEIFKYQKINLNKFANCIDLRQQFKDYTKNFGSSAATSIASILDSYGLKYQFDESKKNGTIRDCIKQFKIVDDDNNKTLKYTKLYNFKNQLRQTLYEGYPIIFGFTVYESFDSDEVKKTGIIPIPKRGEKILGGLCCVIVGFNNETNQWIVRNPCNNQYLYIPYDLLSKENNSSGDFWRISYE